LRDADAAGDGVAGVAEEDMSALLCVTMGRTLGPHAT
jgi:hypothetical protein